MSQKNEFGAFLMGFFVGALAGTGVALLFAPQSGDETRDQIRQKGIELSDKASHLAEDAREKAEAAMAEARAKMEEATAELQARAKELQEQGKAMLEEKHLLQKAEEAPKAG